MSGPRHHLGTQADPITLSDSDDEPAPARTPRRPRRVTGLRAEPAAMPTTSDSDSDANDLAAQLSKMRARERGDVAGPSVLAQALVTATHSTQQNGHAQATFTDQDKGKGKQREIPAAPAQRAMHDFFSSNADAGPSRSPIVIDSSDGDDKPAPVERKKRHPTSESPLKKRKRRRTFDGFEEGTALGTWGNFEPLVVERRPPPPKDPSPPGPKLGEWGNFERLEAPALAAANKSKGKGIAPQPERAPTPEPPAPVPISKGMTARKSTGGKRPTGMRSYGARGLPQTEEEVTSPFTLHPTASAATHADVQPPAGSAQVAATTRTGPSWVTQDTPSDKAPSRSVSRPSSTSRPTSNRPSPEAGPSAPKSVSPAPVPASPKIIPAPSRLGSTPPLPRETKSPTPVKMEVDEVPLDSNGLSDFSQEEAPIPPLPSTSLFSTPPSDTPGSDAPISPLPGRSIETTPIPMLQPEQSSHEFEIADSSEHRDSDKAAKPLDDTRPRSPQSRDAYRANNMDSADASSSAHSFVFTDTSPDEAEPGVSGATEGMSVEMTTSQAEPTKARAAEEKGKGRPIEPLFPEWEAGPLEPRAARRRSRSSASYEEVVVTPYAGHLENPIEISDDEEDVAITARVSRQQWEQLFENAQRHTDGEGLFQGKDSVEASELAPPGMRGRANRKLDARLIDQYHRIVEKHAIPNNALHRELFETYMSISTAEDEPNAPTIKVVNMVDGAPPDFEFQYSNQMLYTDSVPEPELGQGCGCEGPCDPTSTTCSCVKRQQLYFYNLEGYSGFQYNADGTIKNPECPIWECGPNCGCPPECMNRVIQRGRSKDTAIELFKTRHKGWGIRAKSLIKQGTFIGVYSGELVTEAETEVRGRVYEKVGRTYLFDLDGYHISHPPEGLKDIDGRAYELAMTVKARAQKFKERELMERGLISHPSEAALIDDDDFEFSYSAYSIDAFHYGFTRYINHSCNPNLVTSQAYVKDVHPERPLLVIFARFDIRPGEEMCISYKGLPDYSVEAPRVTGSARKNKTSAQAHVSPKAVGGRKGGECMCGMRNCDGYMFPR
ncbi:SET domain-containing protein [Cutaneotrichosporon oleaginosum]|uniref:SET domain-containing protein n=1 Tax=Cutaneotrichosporon oleaginosum TaxID=879819 RepID=A0A0J0XR90_9TREE|nr:SET domain-containing protein [Cutaneotrichosporon oleaginosum]KLT43577.1 SET domain-containing protein [Cutaneotrichosporon oleaginosum]TXT05525.1 hypothetical protein COLE_06845 [Cutaneotrichosporon oleaginosum]